MKKTWFSLSFVLLTTLVFTQETSVQIDSENDTLQVCEDQSIILSAIGADSYSWSPEELFDDATEATTTAVFSESTWIFVAGTSEGVTTVDSTYVDVDPYFFPTLINDTLVCEGTMVKLTIDTFDRNSNYNWSPGIFVNDSTIASPHAMPMESDTTFYLFASSPRGFCSDIDSVRVNIIENDVNILVPGSSNQDTVETCLGAPAALSAIADPPSLIQWSPIDILSNPTGNTVQDTGKVSHYVYAMIENQGCLDVDSVFVRIDSLPTIDTFNVVPIKEYYCVGDEIIIYTASYDPGLYPDITHQWSPTAGFISPEGDELNTAIRAVTTITYNRRTTNHACFQLDTILIRVVDPLIPVEPMDTLVCPGETVRAQADDTDIDGDLMWMPEDGRVQCTDLTQKCKTVAISTQVSEQFSVMGMKMGCPASGNIIVNVFPPPGIQLVASPSARIPIKTEVTVTAVTSATGASFTWEVDNVPLTTTTNQVSGQEDQVVTRTFTVTITDENGCVWISSLDVEWFEPPVNIQFPNVFTPDGNGENDFFRPVVAGDVVVREIFVFNRWGQLVFDNDDPIQGWDGTHNGKEANSDVYVWWATLVVNGENKKFKGNITLLR